jgi:hypothetical protein
MLANALFIPDVACGRFDFKGTTDMDAEVRTFIRDLDVAEPPASPRLHDRLDHILSSIRQRPKPTLLIFDTYELAGDTKDWVERSLLQSSVRVTWLRAVVAGQEVPGWSSVASPLVELKPPPASDWFEYSRPHRPELRLEDIETAWVVAKGKASLLAQMLGPAT